jgi:hypothetical protein
MTKSLRYAIPHAIALAFAVATLSSEVFAQGSGIRINRGYIKAEGLIRQANGLAFQFDRATCRWTLANQRSEEANKVLDQIWDLMQAALAADEQDLAKDLDAAGQNLYDALEYFYWECPPQSPLRWVTASKSPNIEFSTATGVLELAMPKRSFLGSESGGVPRTGLFTPDQNASGASFSASLKFDMGNYLSSFNLGGSSSTWTKVGVYYAHVDSSQPIGTIDAGAGNRLLLPGPTGGASGFSIPPGFPAQGVQYSNDLSKTGGRVDFGQSTHFPISYSIDFWGSLGYSRYSFHEKFSGTTAGFNFGYNSDANVDQFRVRFGVGLRKEWLLQTGLTASLGAYGEVGPDFSRASSTDTLSFTGFPTSASSPGASDTAAGYRLGLIAGIKNAYGFGLSVEAAYMRETGLPVFDRDGTNPTTLVLSSGDAWTVMGRGRLSF